MLVAPVKRHILLPVERTESRKYSTGPGCTNDSPHPCKPPPYSSCPLPDTSDPRTRCMKSCAIQVMPCASKPPTYSACVHPHHLNPTPSPSSKPSVRPSASRHLPRRVEASTLRGGRLPSLRGTHNSRELSTSTWTLLKSATSRGCITSILTVGRCTPGQYGSTPARPARGTARRRAPNAG